MIIQGVDLIGGDYIAQSTVTDGLTMWLDAQNSTSYPGSGSTWYDLSSTGSNITLVNSPTYTSSPTAYFTFNSASSQSGTGNTNNVVPSTAYTKSVWFYLNSYTDNNLISSDAGGHFIFMAGTNKIYSGHTNWPSYTVFPSVTSLSLNTWYYTALTFNTTDGMVLYINGVQDSTYTANKSAHGGNGSTNVGRFGAGNFLNGRVAAFYCYNRALTSSEIQQNFNANKARYGY